MLQPETPWATPSTGVLYGTLIGWRGAGGAYLDRRDPESGHLKFGRYMYRLRHYIASLFLTAALAAPISIMALPRPQDAGVQVRVYDKGHKDYHNWDNNENRAWGVYLSDNHKSSHEYSKANKKEQSQYWNWRHDHPDDADHRDKR